MIRHPLLEVTRHGLECLIINRNMVGVDPEYLAPAFAASVFETQVNVGECLVDLGVDVAVDIACLRVPAAWEASVQA